MVYYKVMFKFPHSLPNKTFEDLIVRWFRPIKNNESVSILNVSSSSQWHFIHQLLNRRSLLKKYCINVAETQFLILDLNSFPIESKDEFKIYLKDAIKKNAKKVIFFVQGSENLLSEKLELLTYFDLLNRRNLFSFLLFFKKNITLPKFTQAFSKYDLLYQNIIPTAFYKKEDMYHFILHEAGRYKIDLSKKLVDSIYLECAGRMILAKHAVRYYSRTKDEKGIFSHEEMKIKLRMMYEEFEPEEKIVLEKIINKNTSFRTFEIEIINYFIQINLVARDKSEYEITIKLLDSYIKKLNTKLLNIYLNKSDQICINNVVIESIFSVREKKLTREFLKRRNELISRNDVASILWGENYLQKYTDWALDMSINRLRKKLKHIGLDEKIIKTKRKAGFVFSLEATSI